MEKKETTHCDTTLNCVFLLFLLGIWFLPQASIQIACFSTIDFYQQITNVIRHFWSTPCLLRCLELTNLHRSLLCFFKGLSLSRFQRAGLATGTMTGHVALPVAEDIKSRSEPCRLHGQNSGLALEMTGPTRWAPTSYEWSDNPKKWPNKWITGVISPL